jgi:hypothetical protein
MSSRIVLGGSQTMASVRKRSVGGVTRRRDSVSSRRGKFVSEIWRLCAGEMSMVAPKNGFSVLGKCPVWQEKKGVSVQAKVPLWHGRIVSVSSRTVQGGSKNLASVCKRIADGGTQQMASVSSSSVKGGSQKLESVYRRSFEGGTQESIQCSHDLSRVAAKILRQCAGKEPRVAPKYCVNVLEKCPEWQPKNSVRVQANFRRWHLKFRQCYRDISRLAYKIYRQCAVQVWNVDTKKGSVPSGSVQVCNQIWRQFAGEVSGVAPKNCVSVLEIFPGCRLKNGVSVQANCRRWHTKRESDSSRLFHGVTQIWR